MRTRTTPRRVPCFDGQNCDTMSLAIYTRGVFHVSNVHVTLDESCPVVIEAIPL